MKSISELPNIGPKSARLLISIGIKTEEDLRRLGVVPAYKAVKQQHPDKVSLNLLWALEAALLGFDWRHLPPEIKEKLKQSL